MGYDSSMPNRFRQLEWALNRANRAHQEMEDSAREASDLLREIATLEDPDRAQVVLGLLLPEYSAMDFWELGVELPEVFKPLLNPKRRRKQPEVTI